MRTDGDKNEYYWKILQMQVQEKRIEQVFEVFNRQRIDALLIKGWAAARNYPKPFERLSVDIDLAVRPEDFAAGEALLAERKITGVDLHEGLRHLDTLVWEKLYADREELKIGDATVKILRAEDHLRILCVHWLGDGGVDKERLRDVYYAVKNRRADFDWSRCLDAAGERRRKWIACTIGLTEKYLGLDIKDTPLEDEAGRLPRWIIETVEKEWKRNIRLKPLHTCLRDGEKLREQIRLRIPPNPIQATIEMEGDFDKRTRIVYQMGSVLKRVKPSLQRIGQTLKTR